MKASFERQNANGFTLYELLIAIAIFLIMLLVAAPSFSSFLDRQKQQSVANQLLSEVNLAKAEAMRVHQPVYICPTTNGSTCNADAATWGTRYLMCLDSNRDGSCNTVLKVIDISDVGKVTSSPNNYVRFSPTGMISATSFVVCAGHLENSERLSVNTSGYSSREAVSDSSLCDS